MKKSILIVAILLHLSSASEAQKQPDEKWADRYMPLEYSSYDYIKIAEKVGWKPKSSGKFNGSFELFEKVFIKATETNGALKQMKIDGTYYCSLDHDYLREKYNRSYKYISQELWDEYCPILYILMQVDG